MDIDVTDAVVVLDHGHAGGGDDFFDQAFASARDDEIEVLIHPGHVLHAGAVGEGDELDAVRRESCAFSACLEGGGQGAVAVDGLAAAAEDGRVAGFETKGGRVAGDVRA